MTSIFFIVVSIICFCLKTERSIVEPFFGVNETDKLLNWHFSTEMVQSYSSPPLAALLFIILACNIWFFFELVVRAAVCPNLMNFFKSSNNIIDIVATSIFFFDIALQYFNISAHVTKELVNFLSITSVLRLFKLSAHSAGLKIIIHTFKTSAKELALLVFFMCFGLVIFASES